MDPAEIDKQRLADALQRMTGDAPQPPPGGDAIEPRRHSPVAPSPKTTARLRPAFPTISTQDPEPANDSSPVIDNDLVSMPAPTPADLVSNRRAAANRSQQKSQKQILHTRRTIVPILLTLGIMLPALGGLWFCTDEDSPFRALSIWVPIALIFFGFLLLAVAMVNVFYLAHALKQADG